MLLLSSPEVQHQPTRDGGVTSHRSSLDKYDTWTKKKKEKIWSLQLQEPETSKPRGRSLEWSTCITAPLRCDLSERFVLRQHFQKNKNKIKSTYCVCGDFWEGQNDSVHLDLDGVCLCCTHWGQQDSNHTEKVFQSDKVKTGCPKHDNNVGWGEWNTTKMFHFVAPP